MILFGDAEQVGDHEEGEGAANSVMNSHSLVDELVDLAVGEPPHERLVLLEALRRDQRM